MGLAEIDALRAYARMINTLDMSPIEPLQDEDVHYASQWMVGEVPSKWEFLGYMNSHLLEIKRSGTRAWGHNECVATAQSEKENLIATVFITLRNGRIRRIDMCGTPHPSETMRSGEYPS